jgi:argininosuccinate lyase
MKLWDKNTSSENSTIGAAEKKMVERFTIGRDPQFDILLAKADVLGNIAHSTMLESIGLLEKTELNDVLKELKNIYREIERGQFEIMPGVEDVHSQVEFTLTQRIGEAGKKIHSGRSRNDQVLVDLKLYMRHEIMELVAEIEILFSRLQELSETHKEVLIPGYTHLQVAMPSSFGLWFGCYAESLADDLLLMLAAFKIVNQNPLGSAAGYGSSFPLNRQMTTELLGFENMNYNVMYAQMGRGKVEKTVAFALASIASTLSKLSMEVCLMMNQDFGFLTFPKELTTGSSIMPHKKNPDVFELIRGKCNKMQALPAEIAFVTTNLPFGYNRDLQILKEPIIPAITDLKDCLSICSMMLGHVIINTDVIRQEKYRDVFSVEVLNKLVLEGMPFRDAYIEVGRAVENGTYQPQTVVNHSSEGTIGNLMTEQICLKFRNIANCFNFNKIIEAENKLIS